MKYDIIERLSKVAEVNQENNRNTHDKRNNSPKQRTNQSPQKMNTRSVEHRKNQPPNSGLVIGKIDRPLAVAGPRRRVEPKVQTVRVKAKTPLPMAGIFFTIICTLLLMFVLINYIQINEANRELVRMSRSIDDLRNREAQLQDDFNRNVDLGQIADEANRLGMIQEDDTRPPIHVNTEDDYEIYNHDVDDDSLGIFATIMSALGNSFDTYWNRVRPGRNIFSRSE